MNRYSLILGLVAIITALVILQIEAGETQSENSNRVESRFTGWSKTPIVAQARDPRDTTSVEKDYEAGGAEEEGKGSEAGGQGEIKFKRLWDSVRNG